VVVSVEELKAVVDNATDEERIFLAAYLRIKRDEGNGPLGVALAKANERLLRGKGVSLEDAERLHNEMEKLGL
jgi:hypothetical protein